MSATKKHRKSPPSKALALIAYLRAFATGPGQVPLSWHEFVKEVGPALPVVPSTARWAPGKATYCRKCSIPRPERAHHCNVSGFCVLRMDHYCPWINNCVGLGNYKFFLQLVIYGTICSFIGILTSLPEFILVLGKIAGLDSDMWQADLQITDMIAFVMFQGLAIFLAALLVPMLYTHVPFACNNTTAIEVQTPSTGAACRDVYGTGNLMVPWRWHWRSAEEANWPIWNRSWGPLGRLAKLWCRTRITHWFTGFDDDHDVTSPVRGLSQAS
eukprot:Skav214703  [mRNA]  locus=scaffold331:60515:75755:+ [translate_table: standard]